MWTPSRAALALAMGVLGASGVGIAAATTGDASPHVTPTRVHKHATTSHSSEVSTAAPVPNATTTHDAADDHGNRAAEANDDHGDHATEVGDDDGGDRHGDGDRRGHDDDGHDGHDGHGHGDGGDD